MGAAVTWVSGCLHPAELGDMGLGFFLVPQLQSHRLGGVLSSWTLCEQAWPPDLTWGKVLTDGSDLQSTHVSLKNRIYGVSDVQDYFCSSPV